MSPIDEIRLLIASRVRLYREGLAQSLATDPRIRVVATADASALAVREAARCLPDVALLEPSAADPIGAIRTLREIAPAARIVMLGATDGDFLGHAEAGAAGCVPREATLDELRAAIEAAARGEAVLSPQLAAQIVEHVAELAAERPLRTNGHRPLTVREREIVALIGQGMTNKEIASALCIQVPTVKNHVHNILDKLGVERRAEAVAAVRDLA